MISALIPACNEAQRIGATIQAVRELHGVDEIVVVDDGSTDDTAALAEAAGADIVLRQKNRGKGAALQAGYEVAGGDTLLLLDADLEASASCAEQLMAPIVCGEADMTIANFVGTNGTGGGLGLVVWLARQGIEILCGRRMKTPLSGQRCVRRDLIACVGGFAPGWGAEVALTVRAIRLGYRVIEVDTRMSHRITGRDLHAIIHRGRQFMGVLKTLMVLRRLPTDCYEGDSTAPASTKGPHHG